jgi:hypothetical protein
MRMESHGAAIEALAQLPVVVPGYNREHALHELCHASTLGLDFAAQDGFLTSSVSKALLRFGPLGADWNEIWTCAAELRGAELLGWDVGGPRTLLDGNVDVIGEKRALVLIEARVGTDRAYRYAVRAVLGAFRLGFPDWPVAQPAQLA